MARSLELAVGRLRRRVFHALFIAWTARIAIFAALALGTLVLLARFAAGLESGAAVWLLAPLVLAPLAALVIAQRRNVSRAGAVAWLDVETGAGGLVLTDFELDDERWSDRAEALLARGVALPRLRLTRPLLALAPALLFAVAAVVIEIPRDVLDAPLAMQAAAIESATEKLATLEEEVDLEPEVAAEIRASLERLESEGSSTSPESAFEALDRLEESLADEAQSRAESIEEAQAELASAAAKATSDPEAAQAELERTLAKLADAGLAKNLPRSLQAELARGSLALPPGTKLDAAELGALPKDLAEALAAKLAKLDAGGLLKPGTLAKAGMLAEAGSLATLEGFEFKEHVCDERCGKTPGGTCSGLGHAAGGAHPSGPGTGGTGRGRGDAEMIWGEETPGTTERFEAKALEPARWLDVEESAVLGLGATAPEADPVAGPSGLVETAASSGKAAWRRRLAPRHREAVKQFFSSGSAPR